ncbi:Glycosyltransferase, GT2 family [Bowdeniella nasicola]|uniref:Glycosyltransferase, GT2 family n=1 Tax=Bowdeniella nasicola TaxID=208480 RepID=A0A1H4BIE5_9ACTO|nr:glycosyltransferase family A protein [Bowdeniella nasicola]SEA47933.1 Glycosyltransferase, GT2 family [Bowdeniella nasicola]
MSENTAVSIVIPTYNGAATIATQLGRLIPQLLDGDEIIVANNRSTDDTVHVVEELAKKDPRIRTVPAVARQGINHARNTGIKHSRNQLILFCDDDDAVADTWVADMRDALCEWPVVGASRRYLASGVGIETSSETAQIFGFFYAPGNTLGAKRWVFEAIGGFDESFFRGHDEAELCIRAQLAGIPLGNAATWVDYVQRPDAHSSLLQYFHYGRTSIQLWCRYRNSIAPGFVSFRHSLLAALASLPTALISWTNMGSKATARSVGWRLGVAWGHLRYRIMGRPPKPLIARIDPLRTS